MATTFVTEVNAVLKRAKIVSASTPVITAFTGNGGIQTDVELVMAAWNDVINELFASGIFKGETSEATLTLVTSTREYSFPSDFVQFASDPIDQTHGLLLTPYPGGYFQMRIDQLIPANYTGLPTSYCMNPTTSKIRLNVTPSSDYNAYAFKYDYEKTITLAATTDTFPISDEAVFALQQAATERYFLLLRQPANQAAMDRSMALSAQQAMPHAPRKSYGPRTLPVGLEGWPFNQ